MSTHHCSFLVRGLKPCSSDKIKNMMTSSGPVSFIAVISFAIALRSIVSIYPYSGANTPPMYGDYEAQRHWQEICSNLRPSEWYINSTRNDLLYWGLDYPPLTAYHSLVLGKVAKQLNSSYVELNTSRGFESEDHKFFMRLSVLLADIFLYIPAILTAVLTINSLEGRKKSSMLNLQHLAVSLFFPGQILIDNGHFQYNNVSLGLAALAVVGILRDSHICAAIFFSLALNYKQMELYHSVPFFVYLLSACSREDGASRKVIKLFKIATFVLMTFILLWLPWIGSWTGIIALVRRIFPIYRGVFEDKVSNVWCGLNILLKFKTLFSNGTMALICLATTAVALLPSSIQLYRKPTKTDFLYALFNSSIAFFLFSFQVHEKSILLAALPASLLYPFEPFMMTWFLQISTFSMFPLLEKDNLVLPFIGLVLIFQMLLQLLSNLEPIVKDNMYKRFKWIYYGSCTIAGALAFCQSYAPVPPRLPHVYTLLISVYSCLHFLGFFCYMTYKHISGKSIQIKIE